MCMYCMHAYTQLDTQTQMHSNTHTNIHINKDNLVNKTVSPNVVCKKTLLDNIKLIGWQ